MDGYVVKYIYKAIYLKILTKGQSSRLVTKHRSVLGQVAMGREILTEFSHLVV